MITPIPNPNIGNRRYGFPSPVLDTFSLLEKEHSLLVVDQKLDASPLGPLNSKYIHQQLHEETLVTRQFHVFLNFYTDSLEG